MENKDSSVYVFNTHVEAEEAIQSLNRSGFDVKKLSLVGKGYHSEEHPVGTLLSTHSVKRVVSAFVQQFWRSQTIN